MQTVLGLSMIEMCCPSCKKTQFIKLSDKTRGRVTCTNTECKKTFMCSMNVNQQPNNILIQLTFDATNSGENKAVYHA